MKGIVFNIQRFSIYDGPGIRTTVFLKGCNNRCAWCHNPESLTMDIELMKHADRCISCGRCIKVCPNNAITNLGELFANRCKKCGECAKACCSGSLELVGRSVETAQILEEILRDAVYYTNSGGGVTFSGGEPLVQKDFLKELLKLCKENKLHTIVQTAGNYPWLHVEELLPFVDMVMYDFKVFDGDMHKKYVGSDNNRVFNNLKKISQTNTKLIIRTPVIAGVNDNVNEITSIAKFIKDFKMLLYYELIPYHELGVSKYKSLGIEYENKFQTPSREKMSELVEAAKVYVDDVRCNMP